MTNEEQIGKAYSGECPSCHEQGYMGLYSGTFKCSNCGWSLRLDHEGLEQVTRLTSDSIEQRTKPLSDTDIEVASGGEFSAIGVTLDAKDVEAPEGYDRLHYLTMSLTCHCGERLLIQITPKGKT